LAAGTRFWRRRTARYAEEQALIAAGSRLWKKPPRAT